MLRVSLRNKSGYLTALASIVARLSLLPRKLNLGYNIQLVTLCRHFLNFAAE